MQTLSQIPTDRALLPQKFLPSVLHIWPTAQTVPEQNFLQLLRLVERRLVEELLHHSVTANILLWVQSEVQAGQSDKVNHLISLDLNQKYKFLILTWLLSFERFISTFLAVDLFSLVPPRPPPLKYQAMFVRLSMSPPFISLSWLAFFRNCFVREMFWLLLILIFSIPSSWMHCKF